MKLKDSNLDILDQLNAEIDQILSNLAFLKEDIVFLRRVLDCYFSSMVRIENLEQLRGYVYRLKHIESYHKNLVQQLKQHLSRIVLASKQESTVLQYALFQVHSDLSSRIKQFNSEYLFLRPEILKLAMNHTDEEQDPNSSLFSGHLLSPN